MKRIIQLSISLILIFTLIGYSKTKRSLTLEDVMKFKRIKEVVISNYGNWLAYSEKLDRGNGELKITSLNIDKSYNVERGTKPVLCDNEKWLTTIVELDFVEMEEYEKDKPKE